jgi:curli biogenesis system outer membrane secretion channel CsgG
MGRSVLAVVFCLAAAASANAQKKRVAVMNFDYGTVSSSVASVFGTNLDIGKGIADIMVERLVGSGIYSVIERKAIEKILAEQNFSNSDRVDASSAAKLGRILGVDAIIMGSITQFGRDDKQTNLGGGAFGDYGKKIGIGGLGRRQSKAVVAISARMVSTDTAEILAAVNGVGESSRSGTTLLGAGAGGGTGAGGAYDMSSKNFAATVLGEATHAAVAQVVQKLDQNAARLPTRVVNVEGLVAHAAGGTVILNIGSKAGLKVGDKFEIRRGDQAIRDPATGKVIRMLDNKVGEVTITRVEELSSDGSFSGEGQPKVGDRVRTLR